MNHKAADNMGCAGSGELAGDRVICVVARDILALERHDPGLDNFVATVWRGRWLIIILSVAFACLAIAYSYIATPWYQAETILSPVARNDLGGLGTQLGNLGLLSSLAGINLASGGGDTTESIGVLKSRDFARQFIDDQQLLHVFLWNDWDASAGRWKETNPDKQPDIRDAINYFDKHMLIVNQDVKTGLVTLAIRWRDPVQAATWANMMVDRVNSQMRHRALAEGEANIAYLKNAMSSTRQMNVQIAIAGLIETELQRVMVAQSNKQFAFRVIDHAEVPKVRAWPRRGILGALGVILGGLVGLAVVLTKDLLDRHLHFGAPRSQGPR
jgi:uncharacterized protein involved in exopolysaccharide biosynthesis